MDKGSKKLELINIDFSYQNKHKNLLLFKELNFHVKNEELVCILGSSGCGKTTLLEIMAGFVKPQKGKVLLQDKEINKPTGEIGFIFQNNALYPWKTVRENIALGLISKKLSKDELKNKSTHFANLIDMTDFLDYYPNQLSGGMKQKVNLARAFASDQQVILMDEPFASLDMLTSYKMHQLLNKVRATTSKAIVFVTHNVDEALLLSDRIIVFSQSPVSIPVEFKVDLPSNRTVEISNHSNYLKLKADILSLLFK